VAPKDSLAGSSMEQLFEADAEFLVLWAAILAALVAVAIYVIKKVRAKAVQKEPTTSELLSKFRELHSRGELSDAEFRTIKTTLASQLHEELKDNGQTG
jgi:uncharacterized membrane protein